MSESGAKVQDAKRQPAKPDAQVESTPVGVEGEPKSAFGVILARGGAATPPDSPGSVLASPRWASTQADRRRSDYFIGLQRLLGNQKVGRSIADAAVQTSAESVATSPRVQRAPVQRQDHDMDAGVGTGVRDAEAPAGVPMPAPTPPHPTFDTDMFMLLGERFDAAYEPRGPAPAIGILTITLKVHIAYRAFTRAMMRQEPFRAHRFTRAQRADFNWTDAERLRFAQDFISSVQTAWSGQHTLGLNDPHFSEYRCRVAVEVVEARDAAEAHTRITAQKVPRGAPPLRSFVQGDEATLDIRAPTEPETFAVHPHEFIRQVSPFDYGSAVLTPPLIGQIAHIESDLRRLPPPPSGNPRADWSIGYYGWASARGRRALNRRLADERARAVETRISDDMGWRNQGRAMAEEWLQVTSVTDPRFQRVLVVADDPRQDQDGGEVRHNTAAHEAGHMFGLGDEYEEREPDEPGEEPRLVGDRPRHYGDVEALLGADAANELMVDDSGSIMSQGSEVRRGHHVYFLRAINEMTGKRWTVE